MKSLIVCLVFSASLSVSAQAETVLFSQSKVKKDGGAETVGSVKVVLTDQGDSNISTSIRVQKSGVDGGANGDVYLLCYRIKDDGSKVPTIFARVARSVGAKFPQGTNHKNGDESETLFGNIKDKFDSVFLAVHNENKNGVPRSLPDLIKSAQTVAGSLFPLKVGEEVGVGDTVFLRLR